ncbi:MAG: putative transcriptional regulator, Nlp [Rhodocyclales bacterium]|nr:putative transcriptional regulator, Nlp [Rhodocyclales bacterium]
MAKDNVKKTSLETEDWHQADILAALHKRSITLASLARKHGLTSSSTLSAAMIRSYPANEKRIAEALEKHPKEIWPTRYNEDGSRKPQGLRQCTAPKRARNGNNKAAA